MAGLALAPSFLMPDFTSRPHEQTHELDLAQSSYASHDDATPLALSPPSYASFDFDSEDDVWACRWPACTWTGRSYEDLGDHLAFHTAQHSFLCDWPGCPEGFGDQHTFIVHYRNHLLAEEQQLHHSVPPSSISAPPPALFVDVGDPAMFSKHWEHHPGSNSCPPTVHLASPPQTPTYADGPPAFVPYPGPPLHHPQESALLTAPTTPDGTHVPHMYTHLPPSPVSPVSMHPHLSPTCDDYPDQNMGSSYYHHAGPPLQVLRQPMDAPAAGRPAPPHAQFFQTLALSRNSALCVVSSADKLHRCREFYRFFLAIFRSVRLTGLSRCRTQWLQQELQATGTPS
jgi:hypothetical protein